MCAVCVSDYIALNHRLVDYEVERIWKEAVVSCLRHLSGGTVGSAGNEETCVN